MTSDGKVDNILNNLMAIMSPESIDSNKIASCFNENFEANLNELSNTSEIMNVQSKEKFTESLKQLGIVEFLENDKLRLILNHNLVVLVMMNIPLKWTNKDFNENLKSFSENSGKILRLYKKSMFWFVATEDQFVVSKIMEELDSQTEKIKYDKMHAADIKKKLTKIINHQNYAKETNELKSNNNCNTSNAGSTSKLSWRKASNDTEEFKRGSKCGSINNGSNYDDARKQSYKNSGNFTRTNGNFQQGGMRDRYNSDGQNMFTRSSLQNKTGFRKNEEIEIDLSKIHYSLKITHKYTNGDILLFYDKFRINKLFDTVPKFDNYKEDVCSKVNRKDFNFLKRERSMTYSAPFSFKNSSILNKFDEVKLNLDAPVFKLPNQNPLTGGGVLSGIQLNK
jgi:hypothetical protein